ncbi:MAG: hypothetical protein SOZ34_01115 [Clostridia bacterium]|nr:hypothetical protein [Clostridia bacterium]
MFSPYLKRILIDICLGVALLIGLYYFKINFIDFLISLFHFNDKVNISSLVYCIQRCIFVIIPLIMLSSNSKFPKAAILKYFFIIIGVCYILANTWIFPFLKDNSFSTLLTASIPRIFANDALRAQIDEATSQCYLFQYNNAYVFNYLIWNSYDLFAVLFSIIQGVLYIQLGLNFFGHKSYVVRKFIIISVVSLVLPLLYTFLIRMDFSIPYEWGTRNILLLFEALFIIIAMHLASSSKAFWSDVMY